MSAQGLVKTTQKPGRKYSKIYKLLLMFMELLEEFRDLAVPDWKLSLLLYQQTCPPPLQAKDLLKADGSK